MYIMTWMVWGCIDLLSIESFGIGYRLRTSGRISKHYKASESRSRMCLNPKLTSRLAFNAALAYIIRLRTKLILAGLRSVCDVFGITGLATTVDRSGRSASGIPILVSKDDAKTMVVKTHHSIDWKFHGHSLQPDISHNLESNQPLLFLLPFPSTTAVEAMALLSSRSHDYSDTLRQRQVLRIWHSLPGWYSDEK